MDLQQQFIEHWKEQFPLLQPGSCQLLLAVSGGVDSVALTDLVFNAGFRFSIAHCNFQLRGDESERDEGFVRSLGEKYGVEVLVKRFDTSLYAEQKKSGIQEAARDLRYRWFNELLSGGANNSARVLTAHHADDNVETVLFNIFRGTGISGLHGIPARQGKIIRPLLFATRSDILKYATGKKLEWVEDSSNESAKYSRNYIRHEVLPMLKQIFPTVTENINDSIGRWREGEELYQQAMAMHKKKLCHYTGNEVHIPVLQLMKQVPLRTIVFEIIRHFNFTAAQTEEVLALLGSESGRYVASASHRVIRNRKWLIITPNKTDESDNILIKPGDRHVQFANGEISLAQLDDCSVSTDNSVATIDAGALTYPLLLRRWKQGDYFYPLGMRKKKKLSRFLIDRKVAMHDKENTWVIESGKRIVWVVGHRIDDRFKITPATNMAVQLSFRAR